MVKLGSSLNSQIKGIWAFLTVLEKMLTQQKNKIFEKVLLDERNQIMFIFLTNLVWLICILWSLKPPWRERQLNKKEAHKLCLIVAC